ncbi:MAG: DUF1036 domain-containing protein [Alteromonas oceani]
MFKIHSKINYLLGLILLSSSCVSQSQTNNFETSPDGTMPTDGVRINTQLKNSKIVTVCNDIDVPEGIYKAAMVSYSDKKKLLLDGWKEIDFGDCADFKSIVNSESFLHAFFAKQPDKSPVYGKHPFCFESANNNSIKGVTICEDSRSKKLSFAKLDAQQQASALVSLSDLLTDSGGYYDEDDLIMTARYGHRWGNVYFHIELKSGEQADVTRIPEKLKSTLKTVLKKHIERGRFFEPDKQVHYVSAWAYWQVREALGEELKMLPAYMPQEHVFNLKDQPVDIDIRYQNNESGQKVVIMDVISTYNNRLFRESLKGLKYLLTQQFELEISDTQFSVPVADDGKDIKNIEITMSYDDIEPYLHYFDRSGCRSYGKCTFQQHRRCEVKEGSYDKLLKCKD